jgi:hypothetical protein
VLFKNFKSIIAIKPVFAVAFLYQCDLYNMPIFYKSWSGIYFKEVLNAPKEIVTLGYGGFALAMAISGLNGEAVVAKASSKKTVIGGCLLASAGFALVVIASEILLPCWVTSSSDWDVQASFPFYFGHLQLFLD